MGIESLSDDYDAGAAVIGVRGFAYNTPYYEVIGTPGSSRVNGLNGSIWKESSLRLSSHPLETKIDR